MPRIRRRLVNLASRLWQRASMRLLLLAFRRLVLALAAEDARRSRLEGDGSVFHRA